MNVAEMYPPLTDDNGNTWWRPAYVDGVRPPMWGWTSNIEWAHPDYFPPPAVASGVVECTAHQLELWDQANSFENS